VTSSRGGAGLRRFARPEPAPALAKLPRIGQRKLDDGVERCEMCGEVIDQRHGHVVNLEKRSLVCTCRGCYLLFTKEGAAGGKHRAIPDRYLHDPAHPVTDVDWDEIQVPVATAFFFYNSSLGRIVGSYPSPGGATECELDLAGWERLADGHPLLRAMEPDVEALMFTRADRGIEAYIIPIDSCYALVGRIRLLWSGLDGGAEVREAMAAFVADLRGRSRPLPANREG
jgi:uncharacterized protein DUF5947